MGSDVLCFQGNRLQESDYRPISITLKVNEISAYLDIWSIFIHATFLCRYKCRENELAEIVKYRSGHTDKIAWY